MIIQIGNVDLNFVKASIKFLEKDISSVFKTKNNKTLAETLEHPRYKSILNKIPPPTQKELDTPLGEYLMAIKSSGDDALELFLNKYGNNIFCHFRLESNLMDKGLYVWVDNGKIKYIGRCTDNFKKRVNQGYGKINAKNCFIDGQATNCHLNSKINKIGTIDFYVYPMNRSTTEEINQLELSILQNQHFEWNIQNN